MADDDVLAEFGLDDASSDKKFHDMGLGAFVSIDMQTLTEAWITEANCPEILKYKEDIVNTVQQSLTAQTELMEQELENMQEDGTQSIYFSVMLFQMDIERVRYNLARYLRTRILKIEKCE